MSDMKSEIRAAVSEHALKDASEEQKKAFEVELAKVESAYASRRNVLVLFSFFGFSGAFAIAFYVMVGIRKSMAQIVSTLEQSSANVDIASHQIASSASRLSSAATEQAASLQETATSTHEMTSMVQRNRDNAERASQVSAVSQASAVKGQKVMENMARAIAEINTSNEEIMAHVNDSNKKISEITRLIAEIGDKTKVINDIVFQTKLLSFNASVEAARAGEHGRGFAVVAEEVGNLARMSGTAAKEIAEMLDSSIRRVEAIVNETKGKVEGLIQKGREKVSAGTRIAEECNTVLEEIFDNVSTVTGMSNEIAMASQEQALGVEEIGRAMGQLDQVTQTNSAAAEQAARAAEHLSSQAKALKMAVAQISGMMKGDAFDSPSGSSRGSTSESVSPTYNKKAAKPSDSKAKGKPKLEVVKSPSSTSNLSSKPKADPYKHNEARKTDTAQPLKMASGGSEIKIPSEDDPRFEDI